MSRARVREKHDMFMTVRKVRGVGVEQERGTKYTWQCGKGLDFVKEVLRMSWRILGKRVTWLL